MLYWFGVELNPLEKDLIKYFQAGVETIEGRNSMAIIHYTSLLESNLLDEQLLKEIRLELSKLYLDSGNYSASLKYLTKMEENNETIRLKFLAYRGLKDYKNEYKTLQKFISQTDDIRFWNSFIDASIRIGKSKMEIDTSSILNRLNNKTTFSQFYQLFKRYRMRYQIALIIDTAYRKGLISDMRLIDEAISIYQELLATNRVENLLEEITKKEKIPKYLLLLSNIKIEMGEFESSLKILDEVEEIAPSIGEIYLQRGDILFFQKDYLGARREWFKALKDEKSRKKASNKLEMVKSFL